jgi:hypothetical protein
LNGISDVLTEDSLKFKIEEIEEIANIINISSRITFEHLVIFIIWATNLQHLFKYQRKILTKYRKNFMDFGEIKNSDLLQGRFTCKAQNP